MGPFVVEPASIDFGAARDAATLRLRNRGATTASFAVASPRTWLGADPAEGSVPAGAVATVALRADRRGLPRGAQTGSVRIASAGEVGSIAVKIVAGSASAATGPPRLEATAVVDLGATALASDARIANAGGGRLRWRARPREPWIGVRPSTGVLEGGASAAMRVEVDRSALEPGPHEGSISVGSEGGDAVVGVRLVVGAGPLLVLPRAGLDFGTRAAGSRTKSFVLRNGGHAGLRWRASIAEPFVSLPGAEEGTVAPGEGVRVSVAYDFDKGVLGRLEAAVVITSNGGSGSVTVTGTTDPTSPEARDREMRTRHEHCAGSDCETFRHARARIVEEFSRIESVRVEYQICATAGPPGTDPTCDGWRFVAMRPAEGEVWQADVGPLPECLPGLSAVVQWRIHTRDSLDNVGIYPGTKSFEVQTHCSR